MDQETQPQERQLITKAVIDRFEGSQAVLLVGDAAEPLVVPRKCLPKRVKAGHWLQVELDGQALVSAVVDKEETARARQRIAEKLAQLRRGEHLQAGEGSEGDAVS